VAIVGEHGDGGRLQLERQQGEAAEAEIARVTEIWERVELATQEKEILQAELAQTFAKSQVLAAELDELQKLSTLADRSKRLQEWLAELERDHETVQYLRDQHFAQQERLDSLTATFRSAPDDFLEQLRHHVSLLEQERDLRGQLSAIQSWQENLGREIEDVERELTTLCPPDEIELAAQHEQIRNDIAETEAELVQLLRGRIALLRQREGLELQYKRDFSQFTSLTPAQLETLRTYSRIRMNLAEQAESQARARHQQQTTWQKRRNEILKAIGESYAGFDRLPENTPLLLRELFDRKETLRSIIAELRELETLTGNPVTRESSAKRILLSGAAAVVSFAAVTYFTSWDIGLLAAVAGSGLVFLVALKHVPIVTRQTQSVQSARETVELRLKNCLEEKDHLELLLQPLLKHSEIEAALAEYSAYLELQAELLMVVEVGAGETVSSTSEANDELVQIERLLPREITLSDPVILQVRYQSFLELEQKRAETDLAYQEYMDGGTNALRLAELEVYLSRRKQEFSDLVQEKSELGRDYEFTKGEQEQRLARLRESDVSNNDADRISGQLDEIRDSLLKYSEIVSSVSGESDPVTLLAQCTELSHLRVEIRETRDQLSAHRSLDEINARHSLLVEEHEQFKEKLYALDPLYLLNGSVADYANKYLGQSQIAHEVFNQCVELQIELQTEIEAIDVDSLTLAALQEQPITLLQTQLEECRDRIAGVEKEVETTRELISSVEHDLQEFYRTFLGSISSSIARYLNALTDGKLRSLRLSDGVIVECTDGTHRPLQTLSGGLTDLVWLAIRLAMLDSIKTFDDSPIVWDEALSRLDQHHLNRLREMLAETARNRQIIFLTKDNNLASWGQVCEMFPPIRTEHEATTETSSVLQNIS
jgi:hypothetical protein